MTQLVFCDISTPQAAPSKKAAKALDNPTLHALEQAVPLDEPEPAFTIYIGVQRLVQQLLIVLAILGVLLISYFISTWVLFNKSASA